MGEFQEKGTNWTALWSQLARVGNTRREIETGKRAERPLAFPCRIVQPAGLRALGTA